MSSFRDGQFICVPMIVSLPRLMPRRQARAADIAAYKRNILIRYSPRFAVPQADARIISPMMAARVMLR